LNRELTIFSGHQNFIKIQSICKCSAEKITNKHQPPTLSFSSLSPPLSHTLPYSGVPKESGEMAFMLSRHKQRGEDGTEEEAAAVSAE